jgi:hypothetical protein
MSLPPPLRILINKPARRGRPQGSPTRYKRLQVNALNASVTRLIGFEHFFFWSYDSGSLSISTTLLDIFAFTLFL